MKTCKIFSIVLVSILVFTTCFVLLGCERNPTEANQENPAHDSELIFTSSVSHGIKILRSEVNTQNAAQSITLTATVYPESAIDKTVNWSAAFADPSSAWASGKNVYDYISVKPTSDGALTAVVSAVQPFGEQIIISVVCRANAKVKASCTVDYGKRLAKKISIVADIDNFNLILKDAVSDSTTVHSLSCPGLALTALQRYVEASLCVDGPLAFDKKVENFGEVYTKGFSNDVIIKYEYFLSPGLFSALSAQGFEPAQNVKYRSILPPTMFDLFEDMTGTFQTVSSDNFENAQEWIYGFFVAVKNNSDLYDFKYRVHVETDFEQRVFEFLFLFDRNDSIFKPDSVSMSDSVVL